MTKAEKALAIERVGSMVWHGGMDLSAAIWFVGGLFKVEWHVARDMVHDAMAAVMTEEVDKGLTKIGDKNDN
ncbi:hypothetical protein [Streptomyces sp. NPDC050388]|uniref:hypothetical protein n=1 Tax=Streptomyces sp. NPDC050388 TaxID=3155781 RepID=UPI00341DF86D